MDRINTHECKNCCIKHLSSAAVLAREIIVGYDTPEYRMFLLGNLNEAQEQITGVNDEIATQIREFRLALFTDGLELNRPKMDLDWFLRTIRLLQGETDLAPSVRPLRAVVTPPRAVASAAPCNCRKKEQSAQA